MKFKNSKALLLFAATAVFFSCTTEDDDPIATTPTNQNPVDNTVITDINAIPNLTEYTNTVLPSEITSNTKLVSSVMYELNGPLVIESGAILAIEPGTTIKAKHGKTNVYVAVKRGGKIFARGTAFQPITFTSTNPTPESGDWGGINIAGKAENNAGTDATSEVGGVKYGGTENDDYSGELNYVVVEYTGARINGEQEFNGLALYSVGSKTVLKNIVIRDGADDGIEFFGGNVSVENLFCQNIADDMFDFTQGYTGTITNAFGVRNADFNDKTEDPRGIEGDSNGNNPALLPISRPTFNNVTILNLNTSTPLKAGAEIRRGTQATINNILFAAAPNASFGNRIDTNDGKGNGDLIITGAYAQGNVGTDKDNDPKTITGTVTEITDGITINGTTVTSKAGIGADLTKFSWANVSF